ncbi:hypothetical protein EZS27_038322, partial [termite gut metagenome]
AVEGLRARGGFDIDMVWNEGALTKAVIKAHYNKSCRLRTKIPVKVFAAGKEINVKQLEDNFIEFEAKAGVNYLITASRAGLITQ